MDSFLKTPKKQQQKSHENRKKPKLDQFQKILAHFGFSENPKKIQKIRKNPEKSKNPKKSFFGFSLTHSGGSFVSLGTIINSSRTNPRFGPSFK